MKQKLVFLFSKKYPKISLQKGNLNKGIGEVYELTWKAFYYTHYDNDTALLLATFYWVRV